MPALGHRYFAHRVKPFHCECAQGLEHCETYLAICRRCLLDQTVVKQCRYTIQEADGLHLAYWHVLTCSALSLEDVLTDSFCSRQRTAAREHAKPAKYLLCVTI